MYRGRRRENVYKDQALQSYLQDIAKYESLSKEEEYELGMRAKQGDQEAINRLIQANLKFVVKVASQYQDRGLSMSELISEGNIGLIRAIEKFEPSKDVKLISYAIWWIKQRILQAISEKSSLIRVPMGKSSAASRVRATQERHFKETGTEASIEELAEKMKSTEKAISSLMDQIPDTTSYDDLMFSNDFDDFSTRDIMVDTEELSPQQLYQRERLSNQINNALDKLEKREAEIIRSYFGLNETQETKNFAQIAEVMGLSRERVRQIQKEALKKILVEMKPVEDSFVDEFFEKYDY